MHSCLGKDGGSHPSLVSVLSSSFSQKYEDLQITVTTTDKSVASKHKKVPQAPPCSCSLRVRAPTLPGGHYNLHRATRGRAGRNRAAWKTKERHFSSLRTTHLLQHQRHAAEGRCESFSQERLSRSFYRWQSAQRG